MPAKAAPKFVDGYFTGILNAHVLRLGQDSSGETLIYVFINEGEARMAVKELNSNLKNLLLSFFTNCLPKNSHLVFYI